MRLFGSLQNRMMESSRQAAPAVGMGATITSYTDRHAATITWVSPSGKTLKVKRDKATRTDSNGLSESQSYSFEADPNSPELTFRRTKAGGWTASGRGLVIGVRDHYHDFSF